MSFDSRLTVIIFHSCSEPTKRDKAIVLQHMLTISQNRYMSSKQAAKLYVENMRSSNSALFIYFILCGIYAVVVMCTPSEPEVTANVTLSQEESLTQSNYVITGQNVTTLLNACLIIESNPDSDGDLYEYRRVGAAIDLAVEYVNNNVLPSNLRLQKLYKTAGVRCDSVRSTVASAMQFIAEGFTCNIYIGPSCGSNVGALYNIAAFQKVPVIGVPAASLPSGNFEESREQLYPYLARTSMNTEHLSQTLITFLRRNNYNHSTVFTDETENFFLELKDALNAAFDKFDTLLKFNSKFRSFKPANKSLDLNSMKTMIKDASQTSRVFVIVANATIVRQFMLLADILDLTSGDYLFATFDPFASTYWGNYTWENNDKSDLDARHAYQYLVIFSLYNPEDQSKLNNFTARLRELTLRNYNFSLSVSVLEDQIVTGYYHAIILYGGIIQKIAANGGNFRNGTLVVKSMDNMNFYSPISGLAVMDDEFDLVNRYSVKFMNLVSGIFEVIVVVSRTSEYEQDFKFTDRKLRLTWFDQNKFPPDVPYCGFSGADPKCSALKNNVRQALTDILTPTFIIFVVLVAGTIFGIKMIQKRTSNPYWWRIALEDLRIIGLPTTRSFVTSWKSLDRPNPDLIGNGFQLVSYYRGNKNNVRDVRSFEVFAGNDFLNMTNKIKGLHHSNLLSVIGIAISTNHVCAYIVSDYASKGTLRNIFCNDSIKLDSHFQMSMVFDIAKGIEYIHQSGLQSHGFLMEKSCAVDGRFNIKITDYGLPCFKRAIDLQPLTGTQTERDYYILLWRAPEFLRQQMPPNGSQKGDVYSFGILVQQIISCSDPYELREDGDVDRESTFNVLSAVKAGMHPLYRPKVPKSTENCPEIPLYDLIAVCWTENPSDRPTFPKIIDYLHKIIGSNEKSIVDHLIMRMEQYAENLESVVTTRTQQFMEEKQRSENLLRRLLPKSIADALTKGLDVYPEAYDSATIFFSDIVGFTTISASASPTEVVTLLNDLYTLFDTVIDCYDVYKVETIGDAYMVCSGLPVRNGDKHVNEIALMSLHLRKDIVMFTVPHKPEERLRVRTGFHTGPCAAGAVGLKTPRYCLFGDTVNTASRMESSGEPMKIQISEASKICLDQFLSEKLEIVFVIQERGPQEIKGKGYMVTFWLEDVPKSETI